LVCGFGQSSGIPSSHPHLSLSLSLSLNNQVYIFVHICVAIVGFFLVTLSTKVIKL